MNSSAADLTSVNILEQNLNNGFKKQLNNKYFEAVQMGGEAGLKKKRAVESIAKKFNLNIGSLPDNQFVKDQVGPFEFNKIDKGAASFEKLNIKKEMLKSLKNAYNLDTEWGKYIKDNPVIFKDAGFDLKTLKKPKNVENIATNIDAIIKELGGKEKVTRILTDGSGTGPERTLLREILTGGNNVIKGTGNFVKGALNPVNFFKDFFKLRNLIGFPAAVAAVVYDTVMVTDDMLRKRQPFDVAAGNEFLAGMLNLQPEIQEAKRLLADPKSNLSPAAKEYAQSLVDIGEYNNLLKLKQMPMKVAGMPGDSEDQEKLQKQLDVLEKKINLASNTGAIDYQSEIDNKYDIDQAGTYVGESTSDKFLAPRYKREDLQIMPGESITEYTNRVKNNEKGNLIKVNKYGYGNTGLKDFLGDAPDKTKTPSFSSGQLKKIFGDIEQKEGQLPTTGTKLIPAYVSQNYKTMKEDPLNKDEIKTLTDYERGKLDPNYKGVLGPNQNLDEVFYDNVRFKKNNEGVSTLQKIKGLTPLGEYEDRKKWEQAINQPGMLGAGDKFAEGGIANTRVGFKTGSSIASLLSKFFKPKKTITIKRGESKTIGASGNSKKDFFNRYYFPPKGGFTNQSADARYFSKLGGSEGKPKVLTAEITPRELKEGYRLRSLDSKDPEIGDIIIPQSAKDKIKTDYYNTIRARIEKILKNND